MPGGLVSNSDILNLLHEIRRDIRFLKERDIEHSLEEVSLYRASKMLRRSPSFLTDEADKGNLKASITVKKTGQKKYRFLVSDLHKWQKERTENINAEDEPCEEYEDFGKKFIQDYHRNRK